MKLRNLGIVLALVFVGACGKEAAKSAGPGGESITSPPANAPGGGTKEIFPMRESSSWTYQVKAVGAGYCAPGKQTAKILGKTKAANRDAFRLKSFCSVVPENPVSFDGENVDTLYQGKWIRLVSMPVQEGHSWNMTAAVRFVWKKAPDQTTSAGTFSDCWKQEQQVTYTSYRILCRGVGVVKDYSRDLGGNGWDAELVSFAL